MRATLALIAGEGLLPLEIARRLTEEGTPPVIYSLRERPGKLSRYALELISMARPELTSTVRDMAQRGIGKVILAGGVPKTLMFQPAMMDEGLKRLLMHLPERDDHSLLGGIVAAIESFGFQVLPYREIIADLLAGDGHIAGRALSEEEAVDIDYGREIASRVLPLSFGQTLVVNQRAVVAVEAMEGTDSTLLRAGGLAKGGVVIKMMRTDQDERFDLPTVGVKTLRNMARAGLRCLAVESGKTIILEPEDFRETAMEAKISVVGVRHCLFS